MENLEIDAATLAALTELSSIENAPVQIVLERAVNDYRRSVAPTPHAPDGLPWPDGYFKCTPKMSIEAATRKYGIRPRHYIAGWPGYTNEECGGPEFKGVISEESPELERQWKEQWEASGSCVNDGAHAP